MDLTIQEKVELILSFYTWHGYLKESICEFPEAEKFVENDFAFLDEDTEMYKMNERGEAFLHKEIKHISQEFISYMKANRDVVSLEDAKKWFSCTYFLDQSTATELMEYICKNLSTYGYIANWSHSSKFGERINLQKIQ